MMRRVVLMLLLVTSLALACAEDQPDVSATAREHLASALEDVRAAAEAREPDVVAARLTDLRSQVQSLREQRQLSDSGAAEILAAATAVEHQLALITTTTQPPPPTRPTDDDEDGDDEDGDDDKDEEDKDDDKDD